MHAWCVSWSVMPVIILNCFWIILVPSADQIDCKEFNFRSHRNLSCRCCVVNPTLSSSYRSSRLGLSHREPYAVRWGGCLELSYCNMVEWSWWDSSLIWKTNWFLSVLWHCQFGHMTCKIVPDMTYNVFGGTLNHAQSISYINH